MAISSRAATPATAPAVDTSPAADPGTAGRAPDVRTYVIDTSVLLSDPGAFTRFAEHEVILPLVVISELEAKRHHSELGYFARQSLRILDDLRIAHGRLDAPVPVGTEGGTLRVELNHTDPSVLPLGFRTDGNDSRILACALNLAAEGRDVTLVSKDMPLRVKASAVGLRADEYRAVDVVPSGWTGTAEVAVAQETVDALYANGVVDVDEARDQPCHTGLKLVGPNGSALGRVTAGKQVRLVRGEREAFGLRGRSAEQRLALDLLMDDEIGIVSLGGRAGTGKSALALCAGLELVMERRAHRKVVVFRPLYAVGGQELGYLPGSEGEKMGPWAQAVFDTLGAVVSPAVVEEVVARGMLEVLPLTHIRGRSLHDSFVIVDEAQSLERNVLLTVLSRMGSNSRVVLTHDVAQRDNLRVGRHDGIAAVVEALKGHPLFAHITLSRSERSPIAALVTEMLEFPELS
jgi:PhoH-like ATPase